MALKRINKVRPAAFPLPRAHSGFGLLARRCCPSRECGRPWCGAALGSSAHGGASRGRKAGKTWGAARRWLGGTSAEGSRGVWRSGGACTGIWQLLGFARAGTRAPEAEAGAATWRAAFAGQQCGAAARTLGSLFRGSLLVYCCRCLPSRLTCAVLAVRGLAGSACHRGYSNRHLEESLVAVCSEGVSARCTRRAAQMQLV